MVKIVEVKRCKATEVSFPVAEGLAGNDVIITSSGSLRVAHYREGKLINVIFSGERERINVFLHANDSLVLDNQSSQTNLFVYLITHE